LKGNKQDAEKPMLHTRQFLNIGESSILDGNTKACAIAENVEKKILGKNLASDINKYNVKGEINSQITLNEVKSTEDQASEVTCRRARVSIRARSDFSLVRISISFCNYYIIISVRFLYTTK